MSKAKQPEKPKRVVLDVPGRKKYSSFKSYLKDLEQTMGEMHINSLKKGKK